MPISSYSPSASMPLYLFISVPITSDTRTSTHNPDPPFFSSAPSPNLAIGSPSPSTTDDNRITISRGAPQTRKTTRSPAPTLAPDISFVLASPSHGTTSTSGVTVTSLHPGAPTSSVPAVFSSASGTDVGRSTASVEGAAPPTTATLASEARAEWGLSVLVGVFVGILGSVAVVGIGYAVYAWVRRRQGRSEPVV